MTKKQTLIKIENKFIDILKRFGYTDFTLVLTTKKCDRGGMEILVDYPYRKIFLWADNGWVKDLQDGKISKERFNVMLTHEALHVILWELCELGAKRYVGSKELENAEEKVVDKLAHILCR